MTKLHLGCGERYLPGFTHIDIDHVPGIVDYVAPMHKLDMFEDETVDEIYSCGAFIYYDRQQAPSVLKEWKRVLKPGGVVRTSVPDFESIVQLYLNTGKNLDSQGILGPLFGRWETRGDAKIADEDVIYQKTTYDFKSLEKVLSKAGFTDIKRYDWRDFLPEGYDDYSKAYYPHMNESGMLMVLNVECTK